MKRYYIVPPGLLPNELPEHPFVGEYHYIDLDSHGSAGSGHRVLVLLDQSKAAPADWEALPHLLDSTTTLASPAHAKHLALLADVGAKDTHGGFTLAKHLATIHPKFEP
jgi:hypothetical protein